MGLTDVLCIAFVVGIILWAMIRNAKSLQAYHDRINKDPMTYDDYLVKLSYIAGKSVYKIFHSAAEIHKIPAYMVEADFKKYIENQENIPSYVTELIDEEKDFIKETIVSPFVFWNI